MKTGVEAEQPVTGCSDSSEPTVGARHNGTYTFSATVEAFEWAGIHDQDFIDRNAGDYTMTMKHGRLRRMQRYTSGLRAGERESDTVAYTLEGDTVTFRWSTEPLAFTEVEVTVLPDGSLEFSDWVEGMPEPKFLLLDKVTLRHWERVK